MGSYSEASKARWKNVTPSDRSRIMRERALQGVAKKTPDEMKAHIHKMVKARNKK